MCHLDGWVVYPTSLPLIYKLRIEERDVNHTHLCGSVEHGEGQPVLLCVPYCVIEQKRHAAVGWEGD